jgi:hypothetical protein
MTAIDYFGICVVCFILMGLIVQTRNWVLETRDRLIETQAYCAALKDRIAALDGKGGVDVPTFKNGVEVSRGRNG